MVVPPKHPKMIIFSIEKPMVVGETHHFRKPPYRWYFTESDCLSSPLTKTSSFMAEALKSRCHSWCFNSSPGAKSIPCTEHRERSVLTKSGLNKERQDKIVTIAKKTAKKCLASVLLLSVLTTKHVCKNNHLYGNLCGCNDSTWLCISFHSCQDTSNLEILCRLGGRH